MHTTTVLLNDLTLHRRRSGVGCYVAQLLAHIGRAETGIRLAPLSRTIPGAPLGWFSRAYDSSNRSASDREERVSSLWRRCAKEMARFAKRRGHALLDAYLATTGRFGRWRVYHEPDALPLALGVPTVTTIHDLSVLLFPHWHPKHRVLKYERHLRRGIERTALFLADSVATRDDMVRLLGISADRIRVIPLAPRPQFRIVDADAVREVRARWDLPERYLLYVGTIEPRKNVVGLLRAFGALPDRLRERFPLVLAGGWGWGSGEVRELLEREPWRGSVRWLGYVPDRDVVAVTNGAEALVYPSFHEGFGLPPLEAMACGTPVITTHAGSLGEVVGDAALIVDPHDEDQLSRAIAELLDNPELAEDYRDRGARLLRRYSWSRTASLTADAYRQVA